MDTRMIAPLPFEHQVVFIALTCERMFPILYEYNSLDINIDISMFEKSLEVFYAVALGLSFSVDECSGLLDDIDKYCPDLDESENDFAPYALDACISFIESLSFLLDRRFEHVENCSTSATDTIDMYIQMVSDIEPNQIADLDKFIQDNEFMIRELNRQKFVATELSKVSSINSSVIESLRQANAQEPIIDLQLL